MAKPLVLFMSLMATIAPVAASACAIVSTGEKTFFERRAEAKRILSFATLVIDGEVVEPGTDTTPAKIRVERVLQGPPVEYVMVGEGDSCDMTFRIKGVRLRFVLQGGPEIYTTWVDQSYAREIDRILGSDRRKVWPYYNPDYPPKRR